MDDLIYLVIAMLLGFFGISFLKKKSNQTSKEDAVILEGVHNDTKEQEKIIAKEKEKIVSNDAKIDELKKQTEEDKTGEKKFFPNLPD